MPEIVLQGCTAEPLLSYLKALGVLRLIAEDPDSGDAEARAFWRDGVFVLLSRFGEGALAQYFHQHYCPSPIIVPWSGGDFFGVNREGNAGPYPAAPTSTRIIEAFLASDGERLAPYRKAILNALDVMQREGVQSKESIEGAKGKERKRQFLSAIRSCSPDLVARWVDTAAVIEEDRAGFNVLLGSGGGSDGNSHYSDNFMQHLWDALPEFGVQGSKRASIEFVKNALFGSPAKNLTDRTPSLFNAGGAGGPNSNEGFGSGSLLNSWDFILALEGAFCFAGAVTKKLSAGGGGAAFPFSVRLSAAGYGTAVEKEGGQREIWFPTWQRALSLDELLLIFAEGRAQTGQRSSRTGADFARAVASFGVDSGICSFQRFAFVKGRVGGENYTAAVPLGTFEVAEKRETSLLLEVDGWLERFRRACEDDTTPPRFTSALRRIENAIVNFSRYGGKRRLAEILCSLGEAEKQLANGPRFRSNDQRTIDPLGPLNPAWIAACDDGSPEFRLAAALAGIFGDRDSGIDLRTNLEPVAQNGKRWKWSQGAGVVWAKGSLETNLSAVLGRRLLESQQKNAAFPLLRSRRRARVADISAFLWEQTDDRKLEELIWGLVLIDRWQKWDAGVDSPEQAPPLPRIYALLKLTYLPEKLHWRKSEYDKLWADPEILGRLRASRIPGAAELAIRRLKIAGLRPQWESGRQYSVDPDRLAASLLFPISDEGRLADLVIRAEAADTESQKLQGDLN